MTDTKPSNRLAIFISLAVNVTIAIANFVAAVVTGSAGMLAEAIQTTVDTSHESFLLLGVHQAQAPADDHYPYGQGKAVYFWGLIAVVCFMMGGLVAIYNGWQHIIHPDPVEWPVVSYAILVIAIALNGLALVTSLRQFTRTKGDARFLEAFRNTKDPSMRLLIVQNSLDIVGASLAFCGILASQVLGAHWVDGVASMIVGGLLVGSALWQISRIKSLLIGQSADEEVIRGIQELVNRQHAVSEVQEITTLHMGPEYILVNMRLAFADNVHVQDVERVNRYLERQIQDRYPAARRVYMTAATPRNGFLSQPAFAWPNAVTVGEEVE